jgi:uncharacterized membrane protein
MPDPDLTERLAALEQRLDRLEALLGVNRQSPAAPPRVLPPTPITRLQDRAAGPPAPTVPRSSLEQAIGLRWAGWVGAIVLVIGAGLGIDFAYQQGWFAIVSPAVRVAGLVAIGGALIAAGEVVYRRVNVRSAVGLFAAGVAVLFLAAYAGFAFYNLYGRGMAFVLMAGATVVGAAVARRGDLVSIAALSIVGGNLAPALLHRGDPATVGFLTYLLTLQWVAVALAFRGGPKWWTLRGLSLATTALWIATVLPLSTFVGPTTVAFLILYAVVFHAERIASAAMATDDAGSIPFGACVTAALAAALLYLSRGDSAPFRTTEVLLIAAVTGGLAGACSRGRMRAVGIGFLIQCVGLIVLAVPVATSGPWVVVGWGLIAIALAVAGRWSAPAAFAAPLVWMLAALELVWWADGLSLDKHAGEAWFTLSDRSVPAYAAMAWLLAIGGHAIAAITRRNPRVDERSELAAAVDSVSALAWVVASAIALPPLGATSAVLVYVALAMGVVPVAVGSSVAVAVAIKWMVLDTLLTRPADGSTATAAVVGFGVVAVLVGVGWVNRNRARVGRQLLRAFTVIVAVWAGSVLIDAVFSTSRAGRWHEPGLAEQVAISVWWAIAAVAAVAAGFGRRLPDLRYVGLGLFAVTLLKVVIVDLSGVAAGWRVLSFLGLGGLLLATSVLYGRLGATSSETPDDRTPHLAPGEHARG